MNNNPLVVKRPNSKNNSMTTIPNENRPNNQRRLAQYTCHKNKKVHKTKNRNIPQTQNPKTTKKSNNKSNKYNFLNSNKKKKNTIRRRIKNK